MCPCFDSWIQFTFRKVKLTYNYVLLSKSYWRFTSWHVLKKPSGEILNVSVKKLSSPVLSLICGMSLSIIHNRNHFFPCPTFHWFHSAPGASDFVFKATASFCEICAAIAILIPINSYTNSNSNHGALQSLLAIQWILKELLRMFYMS